MFRPVSQRRSVAALKILRSRLRRLRNGVLVLGVFMLLGYWLYVRADLQRNAETGYAEVIKLNRFRATTAFDLIRATLDRFDFALNTAGEAVQRGRDALDVEGRFIAQVMPPELMLQLFFIDATGYLSYSSLGTSPRNYLGDRDYFRALADGQSGMVVSGPMLGRLTHRWSIQLARGVHDPQGRFVGAMAIAVSPERWSAVLDRLDLGVHDVITIVDGQGRMQVSTLNGQAYLGKTFAGPFLQPDAAASGSYTASAEDGLERFYVWRKLPSGLTLVSGIAIADALAPTAEINRRLVQHSMWGFAALSLCLVALLWLLQRYAHEVEGMAVKEASIRTMLSTMAEGVAIVEPDGAISYYNEAFAQLLPLSERILRERPQFWSEWQLVDADGVSLPFEALPSVNSARHGRSFDNVILGFRENARVLRWFSISSRPLFEPDGDKPYAAVVSARDVTAERAAAAAARISQWVFDAASDGILVTDAERVIVAVNPAFSRITGYTATEVIGRRPSILSAGEHDDDYYSRMYQQLAQQGAWEGEFVNRDKRGGTYVSHARITCQRDPEGHIQHYVALFSDVTERKRQDAAIWHRANFDGLTGLPNRTLLVERLTQWLAHARAQGSQVAVLFIDLDRFKPVNDRLGHAAGDELLRQVARRIQHLTREDDTLARLGGDEFVLVLPAQRGFAAAERTAARVLETLSQPFMLGTEQVEIACSIGVAFFPQDGDDAEAVMAHADAAMYRAKGAGRSTWSL